MPDLKPLYGGGPLGREILVDQKSVRAVPDQPKAKNARQYVVPRLLLPFRKLTITTEIPRTNVATSP